MIYFYVVATNDELIDILYTYLTNQYGEITIKSDNLMAYLGMQVFKDELSRNVTISLPGYIKKILKSAKMEDIGIAKTPCAVNPPILENDYEMADKDEYLRLLGLLNYLAIFSRPDILYALSVCAQNCSKPNKFH